LLKNIFQMSDLYDILNVSRGASAEEIRNGYLSMSRIHHPDKAGVSSSSTSAFRNVNQAYKILSDDALREFYNKHGLEATLLAEIARLNTDPTVDGILVQLPLPAHIRAEAAIAAVDPAKDVDGFHPLNAGRLAAGQPGLVPCTPRGVMHLLAESGVALQGARALVLARTLASSSQTWTRRRTLTRTLTRRTRRRTPSRTPHASPCRRRWPTRRATQRASRRA
jgi:curved DNA-binding protein CbpA